MSESENPLRDAIAEAIRDNDVILFMKGTPERPRAASPPAPSRRCSRSARRSPRSTSCPTRASARSSRRISEWPTIPQLFVGGELVGGCDIVTEMYESGELARRSASSAPAEAPRRGAPRAPTGAGAAAASRTGSR